MTDPSFDGLPPLVFGYFGQKATAQTIFDADQKLSMVLNESFHFVCGLEDEHGSFHGEILVAPGLYQSDFFGSGLSRNPDAKSVTQSLKRVDDWCRKRLPSDFLKSWERGHSR